VYHSSDAPIIVRGEGCHLEDTDGNVACRQIPREAMKAELKDLWDAELAAEGLRVQRRKADQICTGATPIVVDLAKVESYDLAIPQLSRSIRRATNYLAALTLDSIRPVGCIYSIFLQIDTDSAPSFCTPRVQRFAGMTCREPEI
jgi:hypothetical protein